MAVEIMKCRLKQAEAAEYNSAMPLFGIRK